MVLLLRNGWVGLAVVFHAVMMALPLLFSNDVPLYIMYGRIVSAHHANPYVVRPSAFASVKHMIARQVS